MLLSYKEASLSTFLERILSKLPERRDTSTELVELSFAKRTPDRGPGAGMMGVTDWLLDSYAEGIDATVNLLGKRLGWSPRHRAARRIGSLCSSSI